VRESDFLGNHHGAETATWLVDKITSIRQCFIIHVNGYLRSKFPNSVRIFFRVDMFILFIVLPLKVYFVSYRQWQQFWIASSVVIKSQWRKFLQFIGDDDYYLYVWGKFFVKIFMSRHFCRLMSLNN
jgi:hypothetical protein